MVKKSGLTIKADKILECLVEMIVDFSAKMEVGSPVFVFIGS